MNTTALKTFAPAVRRQLMEAVTRKLDFALMGLHHSACATMERHVLTRAQQSLWPELYARLTEKLVFNRLTYEVQVEVATLRLEEEIAFYAGRGHRIDAGEDVLNLLVRSI